MRAPLRRLMILGGAAALLSSPLAACGSKADPQSAGQTAAPEGKAAPAPDEPAPAAEPEKPAEAVGVEMTLTLNGQATTITLSKAIIDARGPNAPMAVFSCLAVTGTVTMTDFGIGDDPTKQGKLFSLDVTRTGISMPKAGKQEEARIRYRTAGEGTAKQAMGTMVWDNGLQSGSAKGTGDNGDTVEVTWKCLTGG